MRTSFASVLALIVLFLSLAEHNAYGAAKSDVATLNDVLVTGELPGPALWKVVDPNSGHVLWVAAEQPLMPLDIRWRTREIERIAEQSQAFILGGGFTILPDGNRGVLRSLSVLPTLLGARNNPEGELLKDLVPADDYARWLRQKERYLGHDNGVAKRRPMFATDQLREVAIPVRLNQAKKQKQSLASPSGVIYKAAKARSMTITYAFVTLKIAPKEMRSTIKTFKRLPLNDLECFERVVAFVEALDDEANIRARAIAWASGDIDGLRQSNGLRRFNEACNAALFNSDAADPDELGNVTERLRTEWLLAVEKSIAANDSTLALLPIYELLSSTSPLDALREKRFRVEGPIP
jgi:hypothetical protein